MLQQFFKYFKLSRTEQNGFFVLCTLMLLLFSFPYMVNFFNKTDYDSYTIQAFSPSEKAAMASSDHQRAESSMRMNTSSKDVHTEKSLFQFDPNTLDQQGWMKLGFTKKQVKVLLNFRDKGGKFYKKEDLAKIYSISPAEYKRLENFIAISPTFTQKQTQDRLDNRATISHNDSGKKNLSITIDINSGDTTSFMILKGIGSTLSKRIVKYRESLGGFVSIEQIKEVYGLPSETFEAIFANLKISSQASVAKLAINQLNVKSLSQHPYISFKQATAIVNYRNQHGHFQNLIDLKKVLLLDDDFLRKLAPYLIF
ncbi:ComEA family DNA-binding protein [Sphingobacterium faecium]|uniref:ComEA family DNA-binding protein n=1 Tax=Sphingobacterium faecium TaxID=34087 RepID=UPI003209967C